MLNRESRIENRESKFRCRGAFALYEVIIGVAIFAVGVLALGRAVENCLNASMLNAEEERVRQITGIRRLGETEVMKCLKMGQGRRTGPVPALAVRVDSAMD